MKQAPSDVHHHRYLCLRIPIYIDGDGYFFNLFLIQITGGEFKNNKADYGGFFYAKGHGNISCAGASITNNEAMEGGAFFAVNVDMMNLTCEIANNTAVAGPAM